MSSVTGNSRALSDEEQRLTYALAKQVPSMLSGVTISTSYGDIHLQGSDAVLVMVLVRRILTAKLDALQEEF
ncbi:hypothetical protein [Zoogloea sp.]|uniref:hypothetical protein n=1 Tax=Zoogloea sp. TaxID=49181 RepID=UPI0035AF189F